MTERDSHYETSTSAPGEWMTLDEVAAVLRVTRRTVERYIKDSHLPATRLPGGRLIRIRRADVDALLSAEASA